jgi:hypothetical protein
MPVPADDNVIVHLDAESGRDLDHLFSHLHARDGFGSPARWLLTRMTAVAGSSRARLTI